MAPIAQDLKGWFSSAMLAVSMVLVGGETCLQGCVTPGQLPPNYLPPGYLAQAQAAPSPRLQISQAGNSAICQPPGPSEYLLLVVTRTQDSQTQVQKLLPPSTSVAVCGYLNDTVTRVGGFRTMDRANAWARYITETTGLAAYVVRPAEAPSATVPSSTPQPSNSSTKPAPSTKPSGTAKPAVSTTAAYNPKTLGSGYAVLVDYFNQPELASKVQQALGKEIGLVAYGQRPYLLATHTTDQTTANSILQILSDRGFWATVVDSRRVIVLREIISIDAAGK